MRCMAHPLQVSAGLEASREPSSPRQHGHARPVCRRLDGDDAAGEPAQGQHNGAVYAGLTRTHIIDSEFGRMPLDRVTATAVERFVLKLSNAGKSESTVRQVYTVGRALGDAAARDRHLGVDPFALVKRPRPPALRRVHDARERRPADGGPPRCSATQASRSPPTPTGSSPPTCRGQLWTCSPPLSRQGPDRLERLATRRKRRGNRRFPGFSEERHDPCDVGPEGRSPDVLRPA